MDATNIFNQEFRTREQVEAETGFTIEGIADALRTAMGLFDDGLRDEDMIAANAVNLQHVG